MHVLLLGGGGREHALAWAIRANPKCDRLTVAPGNAGIAAIAECIAPDILDICDGDAVAAFARARAVDLVVIGPEAPLAAGVADALAKAAIPHVGPSAAAARLETSKSFTKEICDACGAALEQREDDVESTIRERMQVYREQTEPLIDYYGRRGVLRRVDAGGDLAETVASMRREMELPL